MWLLRDQIRASGDQRHFALPVEYSIQLADVMFGDKATQDKRKKSPLCPNIITPNTIPEFIIPPKIATHPEMKTPDWSKLPKGGLAEKESAEREVKAREPFRPHIIQVENVDEPCSNSLSDEESTNADPHSQAALSLPHLAKAQTCYGFCTLLESPHTRRKESLFHNSPSSCGLLLGSPHNQAPYISSGTSPPANQHALFSLNKLTSRLQSPRIRALHQQVALDSDTSSTDSSPFNSPLLARNPPKSSLLKALSHEKLLSWTVRRAMLARNSSLSTDEGSSTDNSPNIVRRASTDGLMEPQPSSNFTLAPQSVIPTDIMMCRERVMKENLVPIGRSGRLRVSAEYCPNNLRLRVRLISAEGLYNMTVDPKSIHCNVSVCLLPGKIQKQRSTVIKRSRNPIFNEDFFFDGICEEDVSNRSLRFKVVNKMSSMKRDYVLGDCEFLLNSLLTA
ncbi:C2 calcium-dependent domain-containing protein 4C-like [Genypterus blacodes]|uniref:C2 calcium-dependent domain-containing protein 4C-like n=1 Tax=Genypterus blacodes TaxID=154954 RepID=UPI003F771297